MKRRRTVLLDPEARADLRQIRRWIVLRGAPKTATAYVSRIIAFAKSLDVASERGQAFPEFGVGVRVIAFESVILAVRVSERHVTVVRVFHGSQNWLKRLRNEIERGS